VWIVSIVVGVLMIGLGLGGYIYTERASLTALIPVVAGAALVVLGILARRDNCRKHCMHIAVLLTLLGFLGSGFMGVRGIVKMASGAELPYPAAPFINLAIALCCLVFVVLGIKSFIDARRRRREDNAIPPG
jgi:hypothetical protein